MSLETLLEAARYVEQQELRAKQLRATAVVSPVAPIIIASPPPTPVLPPQPPVTVALPQIKDPFQPELTAIMGGAGKQHNVQEILKLSPIVTSPTIIETNGFDKPFSQTILTDENGLQEKKQRPTVPTNLRSGTREVHNKLEKNRRAHLKECFELLKKQLPLQQDEKKSSNLSILHSALRYIQVLKKKERENEHEMERLAREKISAQQRLVSLKKELGVHWDNIDFNNLISETPVANMAPVQVSIKEERMSDGEENNMTTIAPRVATNQAIQPTQLSVHLPLPQVVSQGLVVGLHKVALVSKSLPLVSSPVTHIISGAPQLNGKVVPLVNAQYLMKPVVVVSTPSAATTALSPRPS